MGIVFVAKHHIGIVHGFLCHVAVHIKRDPDGEVWGNLAHGGEQRPFAIDHIFRHHGSVQIQQGSIERPLRFQGLKNAVGEVVIGFGPDIPAGHGLCRDGRHDISAHLVRQSDVSRDWMVGPAIG